MTHVLDAMSFVPARLSMDVGFEFEEIVAGQSAGIGPDLTTMVQTQGSQRQLQLGLPVMVRNMNAKQLGPLWSDFCSLLHRAGIPLRCSLEELELLPAASVPLRFATRQNRRPFQALDVATADFMELSLRSQANEWGWPTELGEVSCLPAFITSVRSAAGNNTPVGMELPVGADACDIEFAIESGIDFLTLQGFAMDELSIWGISQARRIARKMSRPDFPVFVDLPMQNVEHVLKCLAIGASVVTIDGLLKPITDSAVSEFEAERSKLVARTGKLPLSVDLTAMDRQKGKTTRELLQPVQQSLEEIRSALIHQMRLCAVGELANLDVTCLRATSRRMAELSGLPMLGSNS